VLEATLVVPLVMVLLFFVVAAGRLMQAQNDVAGAAGDAARAASTRRSAAAMEAAARHVATATIGSKATTCRPLAVAVDTSRASTVTVQVTCTARLSDLGFLGLPGTKRISTRAVEVIDRYRGG